MNPRPTEQTSLINESAPTWRITLSEIAAKMGHGFLVGAASGSLAGATGFFLGTAASVFTYDASNPLSTVLGGAVVGTLGGGLSGTFTAIVSANEGYISLISATGAVFVSTGTGVASGLFMNEIMNKASALFVYRTGAGIGFLGASAASGAVANGVLTSALTGLLSSCRAVLFSPPSVEPEHNESQLDLTNNTRIRI